MAKIANSKFSISMFFENMGGDAMTHPRPLTQTKKSFKKWAFLNTIGLPFLPVDERPNTTDSTK
jgi:hypothetical protein